MVVGAGSHRRASEQLQGVVSWSGIEILRRRDAPDMPLFRDVRHLSRNSYLDQIWYGYIHLHFRNQTGCQMWSCRKHIFGRIHYIKSYVVTYIYVSAAYMQAHVCGCCAVHTSNLGDIIPCLRVSLQFLTNNKSSRTPLSQLNCWPSTSLCHSHPLRCCDVMWTWVIQPV